ncbi:hypothetical protein [Nocardia sp. NPDC057030]|uniref:hypothetical protein n=1 Tax=unclassified Nocardia TaxID=2637762 RepID=UPI0036278A05
MISSQVEEIREAWNSFEANGFGGKGFHVRVGERWRADVQALLAEIDRLRSQLKS